MYRIDATGLVNANFQFTHPCKGIFTGVLISLYLDQEGDKLMFLSEWREFPSAPCLAGKRT